MKILMVILLLTLTMSLQAGEIKQKKVQSDKWIEDQIDETDTYAIPLDSSEAEERQEEQALKEKSKQQNPQRK